MVTILRNNKLTSVGLNNIVEVDLVFCADGRFYPAHSIPLLSSYLRQVRSMQRKVSAQESNGWGALLLLFALGCWVIFDSYDPPPKPRRRWRTLNDEPLSKSLRARVRQRDGSVCTYCGRYAPNGHADHRVSRANGGSNHMNNLSWACVRCNCSKGAMNARQFMRLAFVD